jgi:hypothetical protein
VGTVGGAGPRTFRLSFTVCTKHMYKIQTTTIGGWADLKECIDDAEGYTTSVFATLKDAESELNEILHSCEGERDDWRIVPVEMPADCDIYA